MFRRPNPFNRVRPEDAGMVVPAWFIACLSGSHTNMRKSHVADPERQLGEARFAKAAWVWFAVNTCKTSRSPVTSAHIRGGTRYSLRHAPAHPMQAGLRTCPFGRPSTLGERTQKAAGQRHRHPLLLAAMHTGLRLRNGLPAPRLVTAPLDRNERTRQWAAKSALRPRSLRLLRTGTGLDGTKHLLQQRQPASPSQSEVSGSALPTVTALTACGTQDHADNCVPPRNGQGRAASVSAMLSAIVTTSSSPSVEPSRMSRSNSASPSCSCANRSVRSTVRASLGSRTVP